MSRRAAAFRQIEITRLIRGVEAAGHKVRRIAFDETGKPIAILSEDALETPAQDPGGFEERLRRSQGWQA
jgi:hypothetical protein